MIRVLVPLALFSNGIAAGVMLSTVIGVAPMTLALSYTRYVQTIRFLWRRYDPLMPALNGATVVCDVLLAFVAPTGSLFGIAAVLLAAVMVVSVTKNHPINKYVTSLDPDACPGDWAERDPRVRWRNWNLVRTLLVLLAFAANVAAAVTLL